MKVKTLIKRLEKAIEKDPKVANYNVVITSNHGGSGVVKSTHIFQGEPGWKRGDWRRYASFELWDF